MTFRGNPAEFFLTPELWKVVANICLKSGWWKDGRMDGRKEWCLKSLSEVCWIQSITWTWHFKCWELCAEITLLKILHRTFLRFILEGKNRSVMAFFLPFYWTPSRQVSWLCLQFTWVFSLGLCWIADLFSVCMCVC